jgi:hypothetical protein
VFGSYGLFKSAGYSAGPLLGGAPVTLGGLPLLFTVTALLAAAAAGAAVAVVPAVPPLPRVRQTVVNLTRRRGQGSFLHPRRIHGELATLGVKGAASTVWNILKEHGIDPAPERHQTTWATFLDPDSPVPGSPPQRRPTADCQARASC